MDYKNTITVNTVPVALYGAHQHSASEILNLVTFRARRGTSTQSISRSTLTKVQFNVEDYDANNVYDNVTNFRFTAPRNQVYLVDCAIHLTNASVGYLMLYKNGVEYQRLCQWSFTNILYAGGTELALTTGNYLEIYVYCSSSGTRAVNITNSFFSVSSVY